MEVVCPECHGVLTEGAAGALHHFRCHVGHAFTLDGLVRAQGEELERALWAAVRSLEESARLARRLARTERLEAAQARFAEKAATLDRQADVLRDVLLYGRVPLGEPPSS